jgi:hypothetical protein
LPYREGTQLQYESLEVLCMAATIGRLQSGVQRSPYAECF